MQWNPVYFSYLMIDSTIRGKHYSIANGLKNSFQVFQLHILFTP